MSTATLSGKRVTKARVYIPAWGVPWAEPSIDEAALITGTTALIVADLPFAGTVMSGGEGPVSRSSFRLAAGAGQWGKAIPSRSYANDAGIKSATVLTDAARECGETLDPTTLPPASSRLGAQWVRADGPAARTLELVAPSAWYVGTDGVTRIGQRPPSTITTPFTVQAVDRARRIVMLASETIAGIVPGVVIEGIAAVDVLHELTPGGLRTTIWGAGISTVNRRLAAFRRILEQLDPGRPFRGFYEYRIVSQEDERLNLQPVRVSVGMPDLQRVTVRPGIPGTKATHMLGARVVVGFIDGAPTQPFVAAFEDADGDGFSPLVLELNASTGINLGTGALLAAARVTDPVVAGPFAGTITGPGSLKTRIA